MIIVAGYLVVRPDRRQAMLEQHLEVVTAARAAPGCFDFHLSADPVEPDRVNVFDGGTPSGPSSASGVRGRAT
ncbi:MAG: antibiotic biosynthesis monooxygenase [Actinomycetota bacterium]